MEVVARMVMGKNVPDGFDTARRTRLLTEVNWVYSGMSNMEIEDALASFLRPQKVFRTI